MYEVMEGHGGHGGHGGGSASLRVAVTLSILAVLVALVTLLGHRAHTEELLLQTQASDQWAFFQAKNIRLHEMQSVAGMLGTFAPVEKAMAEVLREKYLKDVERYEKTKKKFPRRPRSWRRKETRWPTGPIVLTSEKFFWRLD
jgi:Domain of unknown function (DUF4337)